MKTVLGRTLVVVFFVCVCCLPQLSGQAPPPRQASTGSFQPSPGPVQPGVDVLTVTYFKGPTIFNGQRINMAGVQRIVDEMNKLFSSAKCDEAGSPCSVRIAAPKELTDRSHVTLIIKGTQDIEDLKFVTGTVKLVSGIWKCADPPAAGPPPEDGPMELGCASIGRGDFVVMSDGLTLAQAAAVWAHEFLHSKGANDRSPTPPALPEKPCALMNPEIDFGCTTWCIDQRECRTR